MKRGLIILGILVGLLMVFVLGTVAFGATTIDGLTDILQAGATGFTDYLNWLLQVLIAILP